MGAGAYGSVGPGGARDGMLVAMPSGDAARRMPRIHPLVPALVAVVAAGSMVAVVSTRSEGDEPRAVAPTSTTTTTAAPTTTTTAREPVAIESLLAEPPEVEVPTSYRITYDVVENGLPRVEEWTVRRPYESLILSTRDGELLSGTSTSRGLLQTFLTDRGWLPIQPELHRAAYDQHPAGAVAVMEVLGLVERAGEDEHLGRRCTVWRTGQPPSSGEPTPPREEESTDVCVDEAGLVLRERWQIGGSVVVERTATALQLQPEIDPAIFEPGPKVEEADALSAAFTTIAVEADEETLARLRTDVAVPDGYAADAAVFRPADAGAGQSGAEIVRFYSSGPALLEVAEVFVEGPAQLASSAGVPVSVDGWDDVWFEPGFQSSSIRGRLDGSSYVELRHHDVAFLFEVFRSLVRR